MAEDFTLRNRERNTNIESNNEKLRLYFLGQLSEAENDIFEEEIALDEDLFEQALLFERELVDDYVRRELSESEREAFEANYLLTESRRAKVVSAATLWRVANAQQTKVFVTGASSSKSAWEMLTGWKALAGFAAILLICGLAYVGLRPGETTRVDEGMETREPLVAVATTPEQQTRSNTAATATVDSVDNAVSNVNAVRPSPIRPVPTGTISAAIAAFTLSPGALRDEGEQSITIDPNASNVDLRLSLKKDTPNYKTYSVTLKTADGDTILSASDTRSPSLRIAAKKLENRTYIIFLEGKNISGVSEPVAEYTFRVRR